MQDDKLPPRRPQETFEESQARAIKALEALGMSFEDATALVHKVLNDEDFIKLRRRNDSMGR